MYGDIYYTGTCTYMLCIYEYLSDTIYHFLAKQTYIMLYTRLHLFKRRLTVFSVKTIHWIAHWFRYELSTGYWFYPADRTITVRTTGPWAIHCYTGKYTAISSYSALYRFIKSYTGVYGAIQEYTELCRTIQAIQWYTELYRSIQSYRGIYRGICSYK